jgi:hypothetical protein
MVVSAIIAFVITPEMMQSILGLDQPLSAREFAEMKSVTLGVVGHMSITLPFFVLSQFFYKGHAPEREEEVNRFFTNVDTEVVVEDSATSIAMDNKQRDMLGKMLLIAAVFLSLLVLIPNPMWGRMLFLIVALIIGGIGGLLLFASKRANRSVTQVSAINNA